MVVGFVVPTLSQKARNGGAASLKYLQATWDIYKQHEFK
jgi:hypothetical protein